VGRRRERGGGRERERPCSGRKTQARRDKEIERERERETRTGKGRGPVRRGGVVAVVVRVWVSACVRAREIREQNSERECRTYPRGGETRTSDEDEDVRHARRQEKEK